MENYNPSSKESILEYARLLLGKSLRNLHEEAIQYSTGKGGMGQSVEKYHFEYEPNNDAEPDFCEAGVELKCTPIKKLSDGSMVSKERLVLNIIDYVQEAQRNFYTSSFWRKNNLLLLMFYMHEKEVNVVDLIFKIVRFWHFPEDDLKIIQDDWNKLHGKMVNGLAHEISEGDTFYLGACPKGSKAGAEMRKQFVSDAPMAQQRAYAIKSKYLNTIILESLQHPEMFDNVHLSAKRIEKIKSLKVNSSIVKNVSEYKENETFEELIERRFKPYYGKTLYEIERLLGKCFSLSPKAISNDVVHSILGVTTPKIYEFEKANVQQKTIRLEPDGNLKESMVFKQINYLEIVNETSWEESAVYDIFTQRFLFIVFRKSVSNDNKDAILEKVFFWTMPVKDFDIASRFWKDTRDKIIADDYQHFWTLKDHCVFHVRPKAKNSADKMKTPSGRMETKKAYWLNSKYILDIVNENLKK